MEKKHLITIIGLLIVAFGAYAYYYHPSEKDEDTIEAAQSVAIDSNNDQLSPSKLRVSLIREMVANYRQIQLESIEKSSNSPVANDAHSILFDLDTLKKFISDMERAVKQNQPNENHKLALRMYYAAYPANSKWGEAGYKNLKSLLGDEITKLYERKHTLIMIPVIKNSKGIYADFNPLDVNSYNGFKKPSTTMQFLRDAPDTTEIPALNHGQLIPPKSNEGEGF
ncbi:MAG: hypothetical protein V4541_03275 [Bacteroidota bacterium]